MVAATEEEPYGISEGEALDSVAAETTLLEAEPYGTREEVLSSTEEEE